MQPQETYGNDNNNHNGINYIQPPPLVVYHSANYETTPLLSFSNTDASALTASTAAVNDSKHYSKSKNESTSKYTGLSGSQRTYKKAVYAVLITVVFQSIGFTVVLPSMLLYLKDLGGSGAFYGWIVAIYSVGSFIGSILFGKWSDVRTAKEGILVASLIAIGGNIMYSTISFYPTHLGHWVMLVSRFVVGFGSGCVAVCRAYLAEGADQANKVKMMAAVSGAQGIGFVIGPGVGSILSLFSFNVGMVEVNQYTSPGYLSVLFCVICFFVILLYMPAITSSKREASKRLVKETNEEVAPIFITLFLFFGTVCVFAIFETVFTMLSSREPFYWGSFDNGIYFLVAAVISTVCYVIIGSVPAFKAYDDRKAAAVGFVLLILSMLCFVVYDEPWKLETNLNFFQIALGGVIYSIGYPLASTYIFSLYSKILNPLVQGSKMGWITATGSLARMLSPIWASSALYYLGDTVVFGSTAIFLLICLLALFAGYRLLIPHKDYGREYIVSNPPSSTKA